MHLIDRIWFFGDSYCADDSEGTYIDKLSKLHNAEIMHLGQNGHGPISAYERFLEQKKHVEQNTDLLIFMWSGQHRKLDKHDLHLPEQGVIMHDKLVNPNYINALKNYYKFIHNKRHDSIIFQSIVKATMLECDHKSFKNLHYFCFPEEAKIFNETFNLSYFSLTRDDYNNFSNEDIKYFKNHFSPEGHEHLVHKINNDFKDKYEKHLN